MKIYEVVVFNNSNGWDVRCRCDIDNKPGFERQVDENGVPTGVIKNTIFETGEVRYGYIAYTGPESKAKNFANLIKFGYKGNDTPQYVYCKSLNETAKNLTIGFGQVKIDNSIARMPKEKFERLQMYYRGYK
jgi:hypothetical protein